MHEHGMETQLVRLEKSTLFPPPHAQTPRIPHFSSLGADLI